jgi:hypothetical protein
VPTLRDEGEDDEARASRLAVAAACPVFGPIEGCLGDDLRGDMGSSWERITEATDVMDWLRLAMRPLPFGDVLFGGSGSEGAALQSSVGDAMGAGRHVSQNHHHGTYCGEERFLTTPTRRAKFAFEPKPSRVLATELRRIYGLRIPIVARPK